LKVPTNIWVLSFGYPQTDFQLKMFFLFDSSSMTFVTDTAFLPPKNQGISVLILQVAWMATKDELH